MTTPIPPAILENIQAEVQEIRNQVEQLRPPQRPVMFEFPEKVPRAVVAPERYTSSLPTAVLKALRRYAEHDGGKHINVVISEALRAYIPPSHFEAVVQDMYLEQRRLWSEEATPEERRG